MPLNNRPRGRNKNVTGEGKDIYKRGSGNGGGPVGGGTSGRPVGGSSGRNLSGEASGGFSGGGQSVRGTSGSSVRGLSSLFSGKKGLIILLVIAAIVLFFVFRGKLFGSSNDDPSQQPTESSSSLLDLLSGGFSGGNVSTGWTRTANTGKLDGTVASGADNKSTEIYGNGLDRATVMIYMCGTDLESEGGMASADLSEIKKAAESEKVNVVIYTGGCKNWKSDGISSSVNQMYTVENGRLRTLVADDGSKGMTVPSTLVSFVERAASMYPANRNMLIFWDHGGGSVSGYGYDEKNTKNGSMTLAGINTALGSLKEKGITFDFIGFDACLMATAENALMLSPYADYLIASEETEPGIGWYYTDWLSMLANDTSVSTLKLGQKIADDFVDVCAAKCNGQKATLSLVDLKELKATLPTALNSFALSTSSLLENDSYKTVSDARAATREFSTSKIDQVDLVNLADRMGTIEGKRLAEAVLGAVKYNRTSSNMSDAYGLSIYFPYRSASTVDSAVRTYEAIDMDDDYAKCIRQFAGLGTAGQAVSGGSSSSLSSLFGALTGSSGGSQGVSGVGAISELLGGFIGGDVLPQITGLTSSNTGFLSSLLGMDRAASYLDANAFDGSALKWEKVGGKYLLSLPEKQWELVHDLELNVFFDDGEGYIDLGLDNVFDFDKEGRLKGEYDGTWLAINGQPVAYYHTDTLDDGENYTITGRVPVKYNGKRADLILVFDNAHEDGYIAGVRYDYRDGETDTVAKAVETVKAGDTIDFLCDYYSYDGSYIDNYMLGDRMTVGEELTIGNVYIDAAKASACYRFTDMYGQNYWTPEIP